MHEKEAGLKAKLIEGAKDVNGVKLVSICTSMPAEIVKNLAFQIRAELPHSFFVAGTQDNNRPMLTVAISDDLVANGLKAGMMVKEAAKLIQGGGGGQPHFAQAGGKNVDGLRAAVDKIIELANL